MPDGDQHVVEPVPLADVVVRVVRGDDLDARPLGELRQGGHALRIADRRRGAAIRRKKRLWAEDLAVLGGDGLCLALERRIVLTQRLGSSRAISPCAAAGEHDQSVAVLEEPLLVACAA